MASKPATYTSPNSPPPNYSQTGPSSSTFRPQQETPYQPPMSPGPNAANKMTPYQSGPIAPPDPAYGGYYNNNQQGPYGPPAQGYYGPPGGQGGYYGQQGPPPQGMYPQGPQGMYYQQQPPQPMYGYPQQQPYGYYHDDRQGPGGGICAGLLGALACCCCMDMLLF